ncbi:MAG: sugar phosphate isomerase/epimerase [Clostridia bacterium]|nr:sugar phosphate isomerase/epimerase [Clostridia bacterium]
MSNKFSFSTLGCPEWTFDQIVSQAVSLGFGAIELRGIQGEMRLDKIPEFTAENRANTRAKLAENGLALCCLDTSCKFNDPAVFQNAMDEGKAALEVAAEMGAPGIRVFGDPLVLENSLEHIVEGVGQLCDIAAGCGVGVWLETHGDLAKAGNMRKLCEKLSEYPPFGILWDITHTWRADRNWQAYIDEFFPLIKHLHIRDITEPQADGSFEFRHMGRGETPMADILNTITAKGYSGYYSFEWEKKWHPELDPPEIAFPIYVGYMKDARYEFLQGG